ncbi:exported hypothetical protein [Bradyrhizobium sp. STM 3843]|uniref:DUF4340 domain-containing protein n=1 Tax=Bradyrhizobium sp. STM 3843 TaxID=551947 RepID=UPI00024037B6|nr:DUF4340 domain-containing protein [Bradyrhizobium sp. STM 3843]CCE08422.1 exported hypothetical protein [Bradyrhizobium sp. STM 3843]
MRRPTVLLLTALLGGQLALALVIARTGSDHAAFSAKDPLLAFEPAKIDQIAIDDDAGHAVTLDKQNGEWVIPASAGFPADQGRVESFLSQLAALKRGLPVAETAGAAERFKLTEKVHDRRVVLTSGGQKVGELLIGTSPTYRQVHARLSGAPAIYVVDFAAYDAESDAAAWMNHGLLDTPRNKIASIAVGDVTLDGKDGKFALAGLTQDDKPLADKIDSLVGAVAHPLFDAVQGKGKDALAKVDDPDVTATVKRADGSSVTYRYKKDAGFYLFASSAQDYLFRVADDKIKPVIEAKRAALIEAPKPKLDAKPETAPQAQQTQAPETKAQETKAPEPNGAPKAAPDGARSDTQASHGDAPPTGHGG